MAKKKRAVDAAKAKPVDAGKKKRRRAAKRPKPITPAKAGRPSDFSQDVADAICERLADGESLRGICKADDMPNKATVFRWLRLHVSFSDQYARARETQADSLADDITDIADRTDLEPNDKRVRIDSRKWLAGKLRPKKYGDKVAVVGGGAGDSPIQHLDLSRVSDADLAKLEAILGPLAHAAGDQGGEN